MATEQDGVVKDTRVHLTLEQKARLRAFLADNPDLPQFAVSDWVKDHFHVRLGRSTLYRIQRAPETSFATGNPQRKKRRRVKFPDFEQRLLEFWGARREQRQDVSDDELLRKATECRVECGISETELKLSNGWLYRFKARHQITNVPPTREQLSAGHPVDASLTTGTEVLAAHPLTVLEAPGFLNWEPTSDFQPEQFMFVNDGVLFRRGGEYGVNIRLQHSSSLRLGTSPIFKVYCGDRVVGECNSPASVQSDVASSPWAIPNLRVDAGTVLRLEFLAPGYVFRDSSLAVQRRTQYG